MPLTERIMEAIGLKTHEPVVEVRHTPSIALQIHVWLKALPVSASTVLSMHKESRAATPPLHQFSNKHSSSLLNLYAQSLPALPDGFDLGLATLWWVVNFA